MEFGKPVRVLPHRPLNKEEVSAESEPRLLFSMDHIDTATVKRDVQVSSGGYSSVSTKKDAPTPELQPPKVIPRQLPKALPPSVLREKQLQPPPALQPKLSFESLKRRKKQVTFVQKPPEGLETNCGLCHDVLTEPYQTSCCGNYICSNCKEDKQGHSHSCPYCKSRIMVTFLDLNRQNHINGLHIYCAYMKEGCPWSGKLGELEYHLNERKRKPSAKEEIAAQQHSREQLPSRHEGCLYAHVICKNTDCYEMVKRSKLKTHEDETCPMRPFLCEYCNRKQVRPSLHYNQCSQYPVPCPNNCQLTITRGRLESHMLNDCPLQPFECDFFWAGCSEKLLKCEFVQHNINYQLEHLSLLSAACKTLEDEKNASEKWKKETKEEVGDCRREVDDAMHETELVKHESKLLSTQIMLVKRSCDALEKKLYQAVHGNLPVLQPDKPILIKAGAKKMYFFSGEYGYKMAARLSSNYSGIGGGGGGGGGSAKAAITNTLSQLSQRVGKASTDNLEMMVYSDGGIHKVSPEVTEVTITTNSGIRVTLVQGHELHSKPVHSSIESQRLSANISDPGDTIKIVNVQ